MKEEVLVKGKVCPECGRATHVYVIEKLPVSSGFRLAGDLDDAVFAITDEGKAVLDETLQCLRSKG